MNLPHIPCEEAAVNVEKTLLDKLSFKEKLKTRWHMFLCKKCREYENDSKVLHRILCSIKTEKKVDPLNEEEKNKLKKALN